MSGMIGYRLPNDISIQSFCCYFRKFVRIDESIFCGAASKRTAHCRPASQPMFENIIVSSD